MLRQHHRSISARRGAAMTAAVVAAFTATSLLWVMMTLASFSAEEADIDRRRAEARYLGLGALEAAEKRVLDSVANWKSVPSVGTVDIAGHEIGYTINPTAHQDVVLDSAGIQTIVQSYEIQAKARAGQ